MVCGGVEVSEKRMKKQCENFTKTIQKTFSISIPSLLFCLQPVAF
jgi:hypothetical protein